MRALGPEAVSAACCVCDPRPAACSALSFLVDGALYETKTADEVRGAAARWRRPAWRSDPHPSQVVMPVGEHYVILDTAVAWYFPPGPDAAYPTTTRWDWVHVFAWE